MGKAWQDYSAMSAAISLADDDVLLRDKSDTTDNATHGTVLRLAPSGLLGLAGITPGGRITLESGVPVSTSNQTSKSTIYYTPYAHDWVRLYDGTRPKLYQFTELSLALSGLTSGKNYDVFLYDDSGTLTLELSAAWTNDTTRADALAWQAGVGWVKSGTATRLHLGMIRATGTNTTELVFGGADTAARCYIRNRYSREKGAFRWYDSTDSWTYTTATWREKRGSSNNRFSFIADDDGSVVAAQATEISAASTSRASGFGYDSTSALDVDCNPGYAAVTTAIQMHSGINKNVTAGFHYISEIEFSNAVGTTTWYGDAGVPSWFQTGAIAWWYY